MLPDRDITSRWLFKSKEDLLDCIDERMDHIMGEHQFRCDEKREEQRIKWNRVRFKSMFLKGIGREQLKELVYQTVWYPTSIPWKEWRRDAYH